MIGSGDGLRVEGTVCNGVKLSSYSSAQTLIIPEGITSIRCDAFAYNKNIQSVSFPKSLRHVGSRAFEATSIKELYLPGGVKEVDADAFSACRYLEKLILDTEKTTEALSKRALTFSDIREVVIAGVSYPVILREDNIKLYVKDNIIWAANARDADLASGLSLMLLIWGVQHWYDAFMAIPTEELLDSTKIPSAHILSKSDIKMIIELRLGGKL